jgi:DNA helicase-2/ATP-dependent DNA helicase PcrA
MIDFLSKLNDSQKEAVIHTEGPCLVIAGAGAGKTRVLTYRIAYLLSQGIRANKILALTFTNKAANEMKERIANLVGFENAKNLWMGTFHSIFSLILRREADKIGYNSNYSIYDTIDSRNLIKKIIKDLTLDDKIYKTNEIHARISWAKNNLITPQAYLANVSFQKRDLAKQIERFGEIYKIYCLRCFKSGAMDFDDLLLYTNILFRDFPEILEKYQNHFSYILVDEYQDTNYAQYLIIKKLAQQHKNICVVGDDAQSIYSFRGANIENILNFKNDYPEYKLFKLEQNYRSTQNIVNAANSLITKNAKQIQKNIFSKNETGNKIKIIKALTDNEEGFLVGNTIFELHQREHYRYKDFAILYRTNAQSRIFEEALRKKNIPYKVYGGISFYQRKEIKDLLAYFRVTVNPKDDEALTRIINYPARGIGESTVEKIENIANYHNVSIWDIITDIKKYVINIQDRIILKINNFVELIKSFISDSEQLDAFDMAFKITSLSGINKELQEDKSHEGISRYENIEELLNGIKEFSLNYLEENGKKPFLSNFIESVALITDMDNEKNKEDDKISIMTIHSAKGLEFKNVFITGIEEELFPSYLSVTNPKDLEEERRLFYVAITRSEKNVFLSFAESRYRWGKLTNCSPSRFLKEIDSKYIENPELLYDVKPAFFSNNFESPKNVQNNFKLNKPLFNNEKIVKKQFNNLDSSNNLQNFVPDDPEKIVAGMQVEHNRFGKGEVLRIEGADDNRKALINFQNLGQKQLLLKYAKLRILK